MDIGKFYFIKDQYFIDFPDKDLQTNKENINGKEHNRPCFYVIQDNLNASIYWMVPISSGTAKYQRFYDAKAARYGDCDTIHFGYVLGERKAFLIQNMCPIIDEYMNNIYIDAATGAHVTLASNAASEIERKAKKVLMLLRKGIKLIFPDIITIEKQLLAKLNPSTGS